MVVQSGGGLAEAGNPRERRQLSPFTIYPHGTDSPARGNLPGDGPLVADSVAMPSADMLHALRPEVTEVAKATGAVTRIVAEALSGDGHGARTLDALLDGLPGQAHGHGAGSEAIASHAFADVGAWAGGQFGPFGSAQVAFAGEAMAIHHDAPVPA